MTDLANIVDPIGAAAAVLGESGALGDLVEGRIFGGSLPSDRAEWMPQPAIVVQPAGAGTYGDQDHTRSAETIRIDVVAWGKTEQQAFLASEAAHQAAKYAQRGVRGNVLVHSFRRQAGPIQFRDPDTDWPAVVRTYLFQYGDQPATRTT